MFKQKKGVVMIITLALIMTLTLLILRSTTVTQNYLEDVSDSTFYAQFNRSFLDISLAISQLSGQVKTADTFALALKMPIIINDKKSNMQGILRLNAGSGKLNINNLLDSNNTINQPLYDIIFSIANDYQLNDALFFMALLLDTIDKDSEERAYGSEFTYLDGAKMSDGGILNYQAFLKIVNYYSKLRDDGKIYEIAWKEIIGFEEEKTDYNYLSPIIKATLEQNYGISMPYNNSLVTKDEDLSLNKEQKNILSTLGIEYFVPKFSCDYEFHFANKSANILFNYNLETKRISGIETIF